MSLSKRLNSCLHYTKGFNKLADIGTDHALLPIAAIEEGYVFSALAIDNKIGPFGSAYNNVKQSKVSDKITVILGDGLEKIDNNVDVVVISGMGGSLIANILQKNNLKNVKRFILQPNNDANVIRTMLKSIDFFIIDELIVNEGNKLYDLLVIEPGKEKYTSLQIEFGPINLINKSHFFVQRIEKEMERLEILSRKVDDSERLLSIDTSIALLKEALK